jgi:hypothetical protein
LSRSSSCLNVHSILLMYPKNKCLYFLIVKYQ